MTIPSIKTEYCADPERLIEMYADTVYRLAFARMCSREDAEDVFQDVFVSLVRYASTLKSDEHAKAWLIRVTINRCNQWHSRAKPAASLNDEPEQAAGDVQEETEQVLIEALQKLEPKLREIVQLYYYEGYSVAEVASLLKTNVSTVKTRMRRARALLRGFLEE